MTVEEVIARAIWHESGQPIGKIRQDVADKVWAKQHEDWSLFIPDKDERWEDEDGHEFFKKGREAFLEEAQAVLSALKAAGLVVAPYHGKIERHGDRLTICGITEDEYNQFISGMGAIAIRAATGREG